MLLFHCAVHFADTVNFIHPTQSYIWPLARSATPDETIIVELRSQTTKILLKTGLTSPSSSRGAISSSSKFIGRYVLLMQGELGWVLMNGGVGIRAVHQLGLGWVGLQMMLLLFLTVRWSG